MHEVRTYSTPAEYWKDVGPFLLEDEALHSRAIGLARRFIDQGLSFEGAGAAPGSLLASVWRPDGRLDFAAWWTPPYALAVTGGGAPGIESLVQLIRERGGSFGRCNGPASSMDHLARTVGEAFTPGIETVLHRLDAVADSRPRPGISVTLASPGDTELIQHWNYRFAVDCGLLGEGSEEPADATVRRGGQYFLGKDAAGEPVSMAAITRETPKSACLSYVYTPEPFRGRGYASAVVAEVSQFALKSGKSYCTLFTDRKNPTSNKIYRALGYRPIGEFREIVFGTE